MKKIAVFASGHGSNARKICEYFSSNPHIQVVLIGTNKSDAGVLNHARDFNIPTITFDKKKMWEQNFIKENLMPFGIDLIVLAGFLLLIPPSWVEHYPQRIINIHPALLPKYGGKGLFGSHVHNAVKASGDAETGITIHYVNAHYDEGEHILQVKCPVFPQDMAETIASRVLKLEHFYFPRTIEKILMAK